MEKLNSKELRGAVLGTMLGDTYVAYNKERTSARLDIYHKEIFSDYINEKAEVISQIGNVNVRITEKVDSRILQSGDTRKGLRLQTNFHPYFSRLGLMDTKEKISLLTNRGLAWFWMDDGSMWWKETGGFNYAYFAMDSYDDSDVFFFIDYLKSKNIDGVLMKYLGKGGKLYNRVTMNKENFLYFREFIRPYIVKTMLYKLLSAKEIAEM